MLMNLKSSNQAPLGVKREVTELVGAGAFDAKTSSVVGQVDAEVERLHLSVP